MSIRLSKIMQRIRPSATVSITAKALKLRESGRDIISLSAGEPDFDTPDHIKAAAIAAIQSGKTKYTPVDGTHALKDAVVRKFADDNGLTFRPDQVLITSGAKQACFNACQALLQTGDEAIVPAPYWVSYPDMVRLAGAEPVIVQAQAQNDFLITPEQLSAAITPQTRLLILNSPNNPTGAVYPPDAIAVIGAVLEEHPKICVLSDEIYEHIRWDNQPHSSIAAVTPSIADRVVTINGLSKSFAMSGWRVGYAAGPTELIAAMTTLQSQSTTNACSISQAAATAALVGDHSFIEAMNTQFRSRHDSVHQRLNEISGISCVPGRGAFYLLPNIASAMAARGFDTDVSFCESLLDERGLALVPGSAFGAAGHLRISFAASQRTLDDAMARLAEFVSS